MINEPLHLIEIVGHAQWIGNIIRTHENGVRILRATRKENYQHFIQTGEPCDYKNIRCCPHTKIRIQGVI